MRAIVKLSLWFTVGHSSNPSLIQRLKSSASYRRPALFMNSNLPTLFVGFGRGHSLIFSSISFKYVQHQNWWSFVMMMMKRLNKQNVKIILWKFEMMMMREPHSIIKLSFFCSFEFGCVKREERWNCAKNKAQRIKLIYYSR